MSAPAAPSPSRLAFADALRGIAALWVVLFHLSEGRHLENLKAVMPPAVWRVVFDWGDLGVPVFFVLSGFVMALTVGGGVFDAAAGIRFVARRMIRLTPPYYAAIAVALAVLLLKSTVTHAPVVWPSAEGLMAHLVYLQGVLGQPGINSVFWTLCIEVQFYLAFAVLMWGAQRLAAWLRRPALVDVMLILVAWLSLLWPLGWAEQMRWTGSFEPYWYSFMAGVLVCRAWQSPALGGRLLTVAYLALISWWGASMASPFIFVVGVTGFLLLGAGLLGGMGHWLRWRPLQWLAMVSYSLYLLHNPVTGMVSNVVHRWAAAPVLVDTLVLLASLVVCCVVAWLSYRWVEVPSMAWSRQLAAPSKKVLAP